MQDTFVKVAKELASAVYDHFVGDYAKAGEKAAETLNRTIPTDYALPIGIAAVVGFGLFAAGNALRNRWQDQHAEVIQQTQTTCPSRAAGAI